MKPLKCQFETYGGALIDCEFDVFTEGTYDEPQLGVDGEPSLTLNGHGTTVVLESLLPGDIKRMNQAMDDVMDSYLQDHACEISQNMAERAADSLYESMKDSE